MTIKRNIFANYLSQGYVAGVSILVMPVYAHYMGAEAYGLIGFYTMLQAWFQLLDAGLSTTLARESSRYNGGAGGAFAFIRLKRLSERAFWVVGVIGALAFVIFAERIALGWLQVGQLSTVEVIDSIKIMGVVIACRWVSCLYRGIVTGFEQQVWLGSFNVSVSTFKFLLYLPILIFVDTSPVSYFMYQAIISILELCTLYWKSIKLIPRIDANTTDQKKSIKNQIKFSSSIALTSIIWVFMTQFDKLLLSKSMTLANFGIFSLAFLLSSSINLLSYPIGSALLPRLTNSVVALTEKSVRDIYSKYTQITCLAVFPAAFTLYACAVPILLAWTGDRAIAVLGSAVLGMYSLGNAITNVAAFAYYIQYAKGSIKLHVIGNVLFFLIYMPMVYWGVREYGGTGAAAAWLIMSITYLFIWVPFVHRALVPDLNLRWFFQDVLIILAGAAVPAVLTSTLLPMHAMNGLGRWSGALFSIAFFLVSLACAGAGSSFLRNHFGSMVRR